jgi:hypothetical protein
MQVQPNVVLICNYTTILICNIELLFTRMCMIEKGYKVVGFVYLVSCKFYCLFHHLVGMLMIKVKLNYVIVKGYLISK